MTAIRFILGDQLTRDISALEDVDADRDVILMAEVAEETSYVPHHKQKIALILSAMRHFAAYLEDEGLDVDYLRLDDSSNPGSFTGAIKAAVDRHGADRVIVTEPGEWRVLAMIEGWQDELGVPVELHADNRFFASRKHFDQWASGRKVLRMEHFYRDMRRETGLLMEGDEPMGGRWNFDQENRKALPVDKSLPDRLRFRPGAVTSDVMQLVEDRFPDNFGDLEGFGWPVTRREALEALENFITHELPHFGDYQDAMKAGAPFLYHSLLSPALNLGLLTPREVCARAEDAYTAGQAPINAVEGFIRQILGWREYVRGLYWALMPDYRTRNALDAQRPLPAFYWSGDTDMQCLARAIDDTRRHAYSHHIQRLMVTGNFALLAGLDPLEVQDWYLAVYADAFEWVELPNTLGMALYGDGGVMASKPYAASGAYINRMSDFCGSCRYSVRKKTGPDACPFNHLYWSFLIRNENILSDNPRLAFPYATLGKWDADRKAALVEEAEAFLDSL
jgi:deoxyribodipyrimidine photolyase-related protein